MEPEVEFRAVHRFARLPRLGTPHSAGYDLYSVESVIIQPQQVCKVDTGLCIDKMSPTIYMQFLSRSSMVFKRSCVVYAGTIDSDYRGRLSVLLYNYSYTKSLKICAGERVAQFVFLPVIRPISRSLNHDSVNPTRAEGGFGSTGI